MSDAVVGVVVETGAVAAVAQPGTVVVVVEDGSATVVVLVVVVEVVVVDDGSGTVDVVVGHGWVVEVVVELVEVFEPGTLLDVVELVVLEVVELVELPGGCVVEVVGEVPGVRPGSTPSGGRVTLAGGSTGLGNGGGGVEAPGTDGSEVTPRSYWSARASTTATYWLEWL
jgi:hypothetical protein